MTISGQRGHPVYHRLMDARTIACYDRNAPEVARRYESVDAAQIHRNLLATFPPGSRLLEVGAGSGRDAAFLLSRGFKVVATDASPEMISAALALHPELTGHLTLHALPDPLPFRDTAFDGAYAIASLMHLPVESIRRALDEIARVVRPGGRFLYSVPDRRSGPMAEGRDPDDRLFTDLDPEAWIGDTVRAGFTLAERDIDADGLKRSGFSWHTFRFVRGT